MSDYESGSNEDKLKDIREHDLYADQEWRDNYDEATTDMRYVAGDPWEQQAKIDRLNAKRPCLALDELGQYFNQLINEVRANPRSIKFSPIGGGASDDTARFYESKTREIEYRSNAQIAYTTAFENAVHQSFGWLSVRSRYESARSPHQELWIEAHPNPHLIKCDPEILRPDASDMKWLILKEAWNVRDFQRKYPKAKIRNFDKNAREMAPNWVKSNEQIMLAEFWEKHSYQRKLAILSMPGQEPVGYFEDELAEMFPRGLPPGVSQQTEDREDFRVTSCLTNGLEILKETDWPGKHIPFVSCFGKILYVDKGRGARRVIMSMTRLARDPLMAYCFYRTCEIENVGMTTKNPYWAYEGQLDNVQMQAISQSLHEPVAVLLSKPTVPELPGQVLPHPVRNVSEVAIQALSVGAEEMRRAIQASMGISPLPTQAQRQNEKSGVALRQIETSGQKGSYHFIDHFEDMLRQAGVILEDLFTTVYGMQRKVGIRDEKGQASSVSINNPNDQRSVSTKGDHLVTISAGPSYESEKAEAADMVNQLFGIPQIAPIVGDLLVKLRSNRGGDAGAIWEELSERLTPPQFAKPKEGEEPTPMQLKSQIGQMGQQMQQMQQMLATAADAIKTEQVKQQATIKKAEIDADKELALQVMRNATTIAVAHINAASKGADINAHAAEELTALGHEAEQADKDRAHEMGMAAMGQGVERENANLDRAHELGMAATGQANDLEAGEQDHQQAMQQADQGHLQALAQGQQGIQGQLAVSAAKPSPGAAE